MGVGNCTVTPEKQSIKFQRSHLIPRDYKRLRKLSQNCHDSKAKGQGTIYFLLFRSEQTRTLLQLVKILI